MKQLLLAAFGLLALECQSQQNLVQNVAQKNAYIKRESGTYANPQHKNASGSYTILYAIDTVQHELLTVSATSTDQRGSFIYIFYYLHNQLVKSSSGIVQNGYTVIQATYDYDKEDATMRSNDLDTFAATDEKYALLKESKKYLRVLDKPMQ